MTNTDTTQTTRGKETELDALRARAEQGDATALRALAEQGDAFSQTTLGVMYLRGLGVPQDEAAAVRWCRLAAGGWRLAAGG